MPMNFFTPQTIRNIWGEWGRTPPEPGRQGKRQMPRTRWHPARILPDAPGGVLRGVGAAGICGHGWKFLTGRKPSGQGR